MSLHTDSSDLTGKLLIAMPGMGDPRFEHSVIYLCSHSAEGAMGLIVNKPAETLTLRELLEKLDIEATPGRATPPVHYGGPVETERGFVLHSTDYPGNEGTLDVEDGVAMTATRDILEDIASDQGPAELMVALGYSGWGPRQLEDEIAANGWLTADSRPGILFGRDNATKWSAALAVLGVDALMLSAEAGRA